MQVESFVSITGAEFFAGVPDSQLKALAEYLMDRYGLNQNHIIAANEGNAVGMAAGYYLATGKVPMVYLQNSGLGNIVNPVDSLMNDQVYGLPCIFVVGWRGEPGVHDEPQHIFQGQTTLNLLEAMGIQWAILDKTVTEQQLQDKMTEFASLLKAGKQVAFVVRKGALEYSGNLDYGNNCSLLREEIIRCITEVSADDVAVCTTGKASRELFEIREELGQGHMRDFLTVGSMGHSSSIALAIALHKPDRKVWAIDGDGSALMHMGAMAVIGANAPKNFVHIVINNGTHESVGGMPTVAQNMDLVQVARGCGYSSAICVCDMETLRHALQEAKYAGSLQFIEVMSAVGSRSNLGRPTTTPAENKIAFMEFLK